MRIKSLAVLTIFPLVCSRNLFAQESKDPCYTQKKPLSYYAFRKMMRDHYSYTLLGTQTPTSGFKIEMNKPTITIKGNIYSNSSKGVLVNLELTGGVQNDLLQVFAGDQLNSYFKASVGVNVLFPRGNDAKYVMDNKFVKGLIRKKVCEYREEVAKQIDSLLIVSALEDHVTDPAPTLSNIVTYIITSSRKDEYTIDGYTRPIADLNDYYKKLLLGMIKKYGADATKTDDAMFTDYMQRLRTSTDNSLPSSKLVADINKFSKFKKDRKHKYHLKDEFEIEAYKDIWKSKRISWLNVSFTGFNSSFKMYDAAANALTDSTSFLPSISVSYNFFKKWTPPNKYFFVKAGVVIKRVNSLVDLPKFDYKKETLVTVSVTEELKTEKSGTAYQGIFKHGAGFEIPVEVYWTPWNEAAVPGLYSKVQYSYGSSWINKNKVSLDLGMVWNVANNEKDSKNVLTIVPYMSWANFLTEYKEPTKVTTKKISELFSVNVKFGIPVNLGK